MDVFLNGKQIIYYIDYNVREGWVEVLDTEAIARSHNLNKTDNIVDGDKASETDMPTKKLTGKVTLRPPGDRTWQIPPKKKLKEQRKGKQQKIPSTKS